MGKTRKIRGDHFSFQELAIGGGMSKRDFQYLADSDERLLPGDRGIRDLKRIASIGACMSAGVPLFMSARIANAILLDYSEPDGEAPSGLRFLARGLSPEGIKLLPPDADRTNDYHYHRALLQRPDLYPQGKALQSDALIELIDFNLIILYSPRFKKPWFVGWIERDDEKRVVRVEEKIGPIDNEENPGWRAALKRLENDALKARENAVARATINVSLAIRRALDRIAQHRGDEAE